jgi:diguanylate cyclase (GGDEF)-like protein/PAS domain S-box-containing protein
VGVLHIYACIAEDHDLRMVLAAAFICLLSAFTATTLFDQARLPGKRRAAWLALTGFVSGSGIWATHFVAMLAYEPHVQVGYGLGPTLLSILIAILVSSAGWWVALGDRRWSAPAGGAILGAGIGAMHYSGMAALELPGRLVWQAGGVARALVLGIALGAAALAVHARDSRAVPWRSALLLTLAICGVHFTGMAAASVLPDPGGAVAPGAIGAGPLSVAVTALALLILAIGFGTVMLDRRLARSAIEETRRLKLLADAAVEGLVIIDGARVVDANRSFWRLAGHYRRERKPERLDLLFPDLDLAAMPRAVHAPAVETRLERAHGGYRDVELLLRAISWKGAELGALAVRDITERKEASARISHLAYHDALTGLANRAVHGEHLARVIGKAAETGETVAVLCLDLDGFKAVNDVHGHPAGDALLVAVARRLRAVTRGRDQIARLGGDEFAIVQYGGDQPAAAGRLAERVLQALDKPFRADAKLLQIGASIGIAMAPADAADPVDLMKNADIALYRAKADGRGVVRFYEAAMDEAIRQRHRLAADLKRSIERRELSIHYQPVADAMTGEVVGFEALARWTHPRHGAVSPGVFVPLAEETGFIVKLGNWVLRQAMMDAVRWQLPLTLSVNVSPGQFGEADLAAEIERLLAETGLDPDRLDLEVTEGLLVRDPDRAIATLTRLKQIGVHITMDDFGTGYSSLSYIRMFPFDRVKIDQCFVQDLPDSRQARAIVHAVVSLGHGLDMAVVAEGVETLAQLEALRAEGCDFVQGYLISRPQPIRQFDRTLLSAPLDRDAA